MGPTLFDSPLSTFLVGRPSWREAGRLLDLGGTFDDYNRSANPDALAVQMDFRAVGVALWSALARLANETPRAQA